MEKVEKRPKLKLVGQDGNAWMILGLAKRAADKAEWTAEQWVKVRDEAKNGNYDNLLKTMSKYFEVS